MWIWPGKTGQTTIFASKPSTTSQTTCERKAEENPSAMPFDFEAFKGELRLDLVDAMKNEVRSVLESKLGFFKLEVLALKSGLEEFKNKTNSEIAELRSTLVSDRAGWNSSKQTWRLKREMVEKCKDHWNTWISWQLFHTSNFSFAQRCIQPGQSPSGWQIATITIACSMRRATPRTVIAHLHYYKDCNDIQRLARTKQKIQIEDMAISVFPDFTVRVAKAWAAFNDVRQMLKDIPRVRFGILYPAWLCITFHEAESFFTDPDAAQAYVSQYIACYQEDYWLLQSQLSFMRTVKVIYILSFIYLFIYFHWSALCLVNINLANLDDGYLIDGWSNIAACHSC